MSGSAFSVVGVPTDQTQQIKKRKHLNKKDWNLADLLNLKFIANGR